MTQGSASLDRPAAAPAPRPGRAPAFGFIYATAVMNALSFGLMIPVLPSLIKSFVGGDTASAASWQAVFGVTWGAMQFIVGPVLGMLSDRFGRRPVLLISIFGLGGDFLVMAFAPSLWWLLAGRVLNGMTAASFSTANAYVADVTPLENRARNFGLMSSAFSIGFLGGPLLGGVLAAISLRLPFIAAAALCLVNGLYGLFVLPESLAPERRLAKFMWRRANPVGSLRLLLAHQSLMGLATINFLFQLAQSVLPNIFVFYTTYRYHWSLPFLGLTFMVTGALGVVVQAALVGPAVKRIGERGAVLAGALAGAAGFTIYALAPTGSLYFIGMPVFALIGLMQPGLQGLMSRRVRPNEQGQLQGAGQSLQGIASIIGPLIFPLTFAWAVRRDATLHMPGLAILIAAAFMVLAFLIALRVARPLPVAAPTG
ncbi:MAG: TCR/Tet family MFS transporter [Caulobacteraceae bacterium]|nr:TCR/Tet family MFS transporter [Caulobacteraceae bacterium]